MTNQLKLSVFVLLFAGFITSVWTMSLARQNYDNISKESIACVDCHSKDGLGRGIVEQWKGSRHFASGVGCFECHRAESGDVDAFEHYGKTIATIVSPLDCQTCKTDHGSVLCCRQTNQHTI